MLLSVHRPNDGQRGARDDLGAVAGRSRCGQPIQQLPAHRHLVANRGPKAVKQQVGDGLEGRWDVGARAGVQHRRSRLAA